MTTGTCMLLFMLGEWYNGDVMAIIDEALETGGDRTHRMHSPSMVNREIYMTALMVLIKFYMTYL